MFTQAVRRPAFLDNFCLPCMIPISATFLAVLSYTGALYKIRKKRFFSGLSIDQSWEMWLHWPLPVSWMVLGRPQCINSQWVKCCCLTKMWRKTVPKCVELPATAESGPQNECCGHGPIMLFFNLWYSAGKLTSQSVKLVFIGSRF